MRLRHHQPPAIGADPLDISGDVALLVLVVLAAAVGSFVHERIQGSELVQLKATGHCPNLSAPDETTEAISSFLRRL